MRAEVYKKLLRENKYDELIDMLEGDIKELYIQLLEYKHFDVDRDWNLTKLGVNVAKAYPFYLESTVLIDNALYSGEYTYEESIDTILSLYGSMKQNYKKH